MEVSLLQILEAREQRVIRQQKLLQHKKTLICFTMNIAGPVKNTPLITECFQIGHQQLTGLVQVVHHELHIAPTGCEGYYVVESDPLQVKKLTAGLEDHFPAGRLFDMDVLRPDGQKVSREQLGLPPRKCLLCEQDAVICGRSRSHTVEQLQNKTQKLLQDAVWDRKSEQLGALAVQSLLYEVCTTPKPGLVDRNNSGSHRDMDIFSFMASAAALQPYFVRCARIGFETSTLSPAETFARLRLPGCLAEQDMYHATGGVNTHKGAIFTLGLLCGAAGRLDTTIPASILDEVRLMTLGLTAQDFSGVTPENAATNGQMLFARYGITGVRGQAEAGFPAVLRGLEIFRQGLAQGLSLNDAGCATLLHLLVATEDTNLISRSTIETGRKITEQIAALLQTEPYPSQATLLQLDETFAAQNLSPGGSADLLAAVYFLHFTDTERVSEQWYAGFQY